MAVDLFQTGPLHHLAPVERLSVYHNPEPNCTRERELLPSLTVYGDGVDLVFFIYYRLVHIRDYDGFQAPL